MSAEILRKAAALMRERAEAATPGEPAWYAGRERRQFESASDVYSSREPSETSADVCAYADPADATHIASWHPTVALAVAKAMDDVAHAWEIADGWARDLDNDAIPFEETVDGGWLAVARAYLGEGGD